MHGHLNVKYMNVIKLRGDHTRLTNSVTLTINSLQMCQNEHATITYTFPLLLTVNIDDFLYNFLCGSK